MRPCHNPRARATRRYWAGKHMVYRCFSGGELLYIGVTKDATERLLAHRRTSPWWPSVDRVVMKVFPTREIARQAEADAIREERPVHNVQYLVPRPRRAVRIAS